MSAEEQETIVLKAQDFNENFTSQKFSSVYSLKRDVAETLQNASDQQDFLARHSLSPESEEDLQMPEELCSSRLPDWLQTSDLRISSLKMFPDCFRMTKAGRFTPSSVRYLSWGMVWNGKCLTARILEAPNPESGCILSDILIEDVPEKYYLSQQQMERLLFKSRQADRGNESTKPKG